MPLWGALSCVPAKGFGCRRVPACTGAQRATRPVSQAQTLATFRPLESLNSARIERVTPSMDSLFSGQSIDGVIRSICALLNNFGGRNMPRVLAAFTGFWHIHCGASARVIPYFNGVCTPYSQAKVGLNRVRSRSSRVRQGASSSRYSSRTSVQQRRICMAMSVQIRLCRTGTSCCDLSLVLSRLLVHYGGFMRDCPF